MTLSVWVQFFVQRNVLQLTITICSTHINTPTLRLQSRDTPISLVLFDVEACDCLIVCMREDLPASQFTHIMLCNIFVRYFQL